ncbi:hypothetical protein SAMN05216588_105134 [Pseudomonas flavescens]|uniref:Uncharacterized protein n=1 Tax=Phytopseudomonas flavescens TaxID=29435 RepID=A0A1G8D4A3_9GAMM|nr:hypothetical protein SAMN05216588_105134 [Pseudomonas flavescens]
MDAQPGGIGVAFVLTPIKAYLSVEAFHRRVLFHEVDEGWQIGVFILPGVPVALGGATLVRAGHMYQSIDWVCLSSRQFK